MDKPTGIISAHKFSEKSRKIRDNIHTNKCSSDTGVISVAGRRLMISPVNHMACRDLPVSTPEHLSTTQPFLLTPPPLFTDET
ncbi:hypothetical protein NQZ68_034423 [Dissostichus eleginoides]|nr:hypothetical protein NQZ68_040277 [Dissostichus eleginoides]KAI9532216.1 hypothetical protein NQZ68_034423 [Dissostichus eleginoides]